ncbi:MAG: hypothetical protein LBK82_04550 [Planctomycetaceae bacterium]|jgi:hypothetical protein|nr:hypothetical protein [Planctomycetaceae bacterium]
MNLTNDGKLYCLPFWSLQSQPLRPFSEVFSTNRIELLTLIDQLVMTLKNSKTTKVSQKRKISLDFRSCFS